MSTDTVYLLPDTPAEFRAWLNTLTGEEYLTSDRLLERFLLSQGNDVATVWYDLYLTDTVHTMPDWATDVVHTTSSGFYPTIGDVKRHLDGERPRFLEGIEE